MTIKIVLPEGKDVRAAWGTKVYTDEGHEITGISRIEIIMEHDTILEAKISVAISEIENLEGLHGIVIVREEDNDNE